MTAEARLSPEGQVAIPRDVLDRLAWTPGTALEVVETADGITLRRPPPAKEGDFDTALKRLQETVNYQGPYISEAEWKTAIDEMFRREWRAW